MRLLTAELRKLNRPLMWALAAFAVGFCVLLTTGAANNAGLAMRDSIPGRLAATNVANQLTPAALGAEVAGLLSSMPGALLAALLAGGHIGGEWTGRTLKNLLAQNGYRPRVLLAKLVSTWLALIAIGLSCWTVLAVAGPLTARLNGLPSATEPVSTALAHSAAQGGRALLVLAFFSMLGVAAALLTRGTVGTIAAFAASTVALLGFGTLPSVGKWTPATWVGAWMGFGGPNRAISTLPDNFWSRFTESSGVVPSHTLGLFGLLGTLAVLAAASWRMFARMDVA